MEDSSTSTERSDGPDKKHHKEDPEEQSLTLLTEVQKSLAIYDF